jgi:hypothetical protein
MSSDYLPRKDRDFLVWIINLLKYLAPILGRVGLPPERYQKLEAERDDFAQKLAVTEEPSTCTAVAVEAKNAARKLLETDVRIDVKGYITYNPTMTDDDRKALGLPIHKSGRTPSPVATTYPDFDVNSGTIRRLGVEFYDQGQKKSKAKPAGQHGAEIRWAISDTPIVDVAELIHSSFDTRTPFTLEFQGHERGKTVYFCLCWENNVGVKGPWSEIVSAIIP